MFAALFLIGSVATGAAASGGGSSKAEVSNVAYEIALSADGNVMTVQGELTAGVGAAFEKALATANNVRRIDLNSIGGLIIEAERIAEAVRARKLDTNVSGVCFSACTHVLLGGVRRTASRRNSVGFHQPYTFADDEVTPDADAPYAGIISRAFYEKAKLPPAFIARIFATPIARMWTPSRKELLEAGVLTPP